SGIQAIHLSRWTSRMVRRTALATIPVNAASWLAIMAIWAIYASSIHADDNRMTPTVKAVQAASPSVVNIRGQKMVSASTPGSSKQVNGMGTGIVIDERGYILTNFHVVDGVRTIQVTFKNGETAI